MLFLDVSLLFYNTYINKSLKHKGLYARDFKSVKRAIE